MMAEELSSNILKMDENKEIDLLLKIGRVDAPSSLRAKVEARIANEKKQTIPMRTVWSIAASVAVLLVLNVWALTNSNRTNRMDYSVGTSLATEMNIRTSNQLYYD